MAHRSSARASSEGSAGAEFPGMRHRAPRNRTVTLTDADRATLRRRLLRVDKAVSAADCLDRTILGDCTAVLTLLPAGFVDLLVVDPPYNRTKVYGRETHRQRPSDVYEESFESWISAVLPCLKPSASVYVCSEWRDSGTVQRVLERHFEVRNRITWEREKGRGALRNWKCCSEDIWYCVRDDRFTFDVDAVKLKRRVVAPYRDASGAPKDWNEGPDGRFRVTHPSNLWTDISVPFWSMPENTDHPAQKPEKLIAKLVLASSRMGDVILDPFLGSGTTSVVARKLGRRFVGIEKDEEYCLLAERRLELALADPAIQGYAGGCFWERNTRMPVGEALDGAQRLVGSESERPDGSAS